MLCLVGISAGFLPQPLCWGMVLSICRLPAVRSHARAELPLSARLLWLSAVNACCPPLKTHGVAERIQAVCPCAKVGCPFLV